jgi:hypothetical protein
MTQVLIKDKKYRGRYVAIKDFGKNTVVGDGDTPQEAYEKALHKGCKEPVVIFVPLNDVVQIY